MSARPVSTASPSSREVPAHFAPSAIRQGLPVDEVDLLREILTVSKAEAAALLYISERTLARRYTEGHLTQGESDRLVQLLRLVDDATDAFDDRASAAEWLTMPHQRLDGETPLEHAGTEPGRQSVRDMLGVIQYTMAA